MPNPASGVKRRLSKMSCGVKRRLNKTSSDLKRRLNETSSGVKRRLNKTPSFFYACAPLPILGAGVRIHKIKIKFKLTRRNLGK